jgi:signal transduction histidine kinase
VSPTKPSVEPTSRGALVTSRRRRARLRERARLKAVKLIRRFRQPRCPAENAPKIGLFRRDRFRIAGKIVVIVALLHVATALLAGVERELIVPRLLAWLSMMPIVMGVLTLVYGASSRRQKPPMHTVMLSVCAAVFVGGLLGVSSGALALEFDGLRAFFGAKTVNLPMATGAGAIMALFQSGIWALAFIYPYAIEDARFRTLEAEKLRVEADKLRASAELGHIRAQLEPHFLLNTLNLIAGLVTQNPREARRLLACLGDLLSDALRDTDELRPLEEEVAWLQRYAEILESRHLGMLKFEWDVAAEARDVLVPRLLLQPLVENAVKHGALARPSGGWVRLRVSVEDEASARLVCVVEDNGPGMSPEPHREGSLGLRMVRRRLELRYPDASVSFESSREGTRAIVSLPAAFVPQSSVLRVVPRAAEA